MVRGELCQRFRLQLLAAIAQRVTWRYHLSGLPEPEIRAYIPPQLKAAGGPPLVLS